MYLDGLSWLRIVKEARPVWPRSAKMPTLVIESRRRGGWLCAGRDPSSRGNSNQKQRIVANGRNAYLKRKLGVACRVERPACQSPSQPFLLGWPALHTKVPITLATGPVVPLKFDPLKTNPSTSKEPLPVPSSILALPLLVVQGPGSTVDLADRVVHPRGRNHSFNPTPAYDCVGLSKCSNTQRKRQQKC
jgi:hypothetical protein